MLRMLFSAYIITAAIGGILTACTLRPILSYHLDHDTETPENRELTHVAAYAGYIVLGCICGPVIMWQAWQYANEPRT